MSDAEYGLFKVPTEDIRLPRGGFCEEISPLDDNSEMPVIVEERGDCYRLIDGCGRVSGLIRAGAEETYAICVSSEDIAERTLPHGDDEEWNAAMYAKYAPHLTYNPTTN